MYKVLALLSLLFINCAFFPGVKNKTYCNNTPIVQFNYTIYPDTINFVLYNYGDTTCYVGPNIVIWKLDAASKNWTMIDIDPFCPCNHVECPSPYMLFTNKDPIKFTWDIRHGFPGCLHATSGRYRVSFYHEGSKQYFYSDEFELKVGNK